MNINENDVRHIADLARLELRPEEIPLFTRQLGQILGYAEKINNLDTQNISPTSQTIPMETLFREDTPRLSAERDDILKNAPERIDDFFVVPKILDEEA